MDTLHFNFTVARSNKNNNNNNNNIDYLNLYILRKTALLGTATILRKVLQLSGGG